MRRSLELQRYAPLDLPENGGANNPEPPRRATSTHFGDHLPTLAIVQLAGQLLRIRR